ncbi:ribonuclease T [Aquirhabdus parva]|uniref:Ribonuclease T n=1 Tax=Aquirhabdus parva TaxID=2283318 RepID=A0A345P761_9GAMM|nr:ribonuclease T [Aquirhabdus parva]AXI03120.1 ribonuclease T [Aquirhabdus parva]
MSELTQPNNDAAPSKPRPIIGQRFRGFLPVVVDVETAGMDAKTNALLEIACIPILFDENHQLVPGEAVHAHIKPFEGAKLDQRSLDFIGIDPFNPFRMAEEEKPALLRIFKSLEKTRREQGCNHCVLVGHNAHFDLGFLQAAVARTHTKNQTPFHSFSVFDTVTLAAAAYGQTVLARACQAAGIPFSNGEAHAALYDTQKTAELFCKIVNAWPVMQVLGAAEGTEENANDESE